MGDQRQNFGLADARGGMAHLAVQVAALDHVAVHEPDGADAGPGEILSGWAAEAAAADDEDAGGEETELGCGDAG